MTFFKTFNTLEGYHENNDNDLKPCIIHPTFGDTEKGLIIIYVNYYSVNPFGN